MSFFARDFCYQSRNRNQNLKNHVVTGLVGDIQLEDLGAGEDSSISGTPLKFNMEPEKKSLEKWIPFGNHHFQVPC